MLLPRYTGRRSTGAKAALAAFVIVFATIPFWAAGSATQLPIAIFAAPRDLRLAQQNPGRLVVTRTKDNVDNSGAPPFRKTIDDRATIEKLYAEAMTLPPMPAGRLNCPNDVGIRYHLDFYAGGAVLLAGDYAPTGCASLKLADGTSKSDFNRSFGADLSQALGFASMRQFLGYP